MTTKRNRRILLLLILAGLIAAGCWAAEHVTLRPAEIGQRPTPEVRLTGESSASGEPLPAQAPGEGVGRNPAVVRYLGAPEAVEIGTAFYFDTYTEGEGPAPAWYRPDEPMAAEWEAADVSRTDIGCPDWALNTSLVGWDGRLAEEWELDLYARIVYLEFWGTSDECTEAGADSILRLWELGEYGDTLGELLSAQYAPGYYVYSPYAYVWDWEYNADGLADIRALCEERFTGGPEWIAPYFRLWYYHDWAVPAYQMDNVYFSVRGW